MGKSSTGSSTSSSIAWSSSISSAIIAACLLSSSSSSRFCFADLRVDLRPVVVLEAADAFPAGLPRFFSVVDFPVLAGSFFFRPVELLARGVFVFGVRFAGELFFEDERPPLDC